MTAVAISGSGLYTPSQTITNEELVNSFNQYVHEFNQQNHQAIQSGTIEPKEPSSVAFIEKASGIKQRYVIEKEGILNPKRMRPFYPKRADDLPCLQCEISLHAIHAALDEAQLSPKEVDAIILACSNFQRPYPNIAIEIAHHLKSNAFGFDMSVACSSATFGIATAHAMIQSGQANNIVVVSPEICSGHLDFRNRETHFIFGDACTAVVLQNKNNVSGNHFEIISTKLTTSYSNNLRNNQGFLTHTESETDEIPHYLFQQNGRKVFKEVVPMVCEHLSEHFNQQNITPEMIKRYWLHQANESMNQLIMKKLLNRPFDNTLSPIILDNYANTASAGSIICFHQSCHDFEDNDLGIICSFGGGYSIGSILTQYHKGLS